jgi:phage/plasmid-associated DNA primase
MLLATNNRPRFNDRSEGLWRRMAVIPFNRRVEVAERVFGMDKPEWWKASGELPGVFNWALAGLIRLRRNGRFIEPEKSKEALEDYKTEVNPARAFLEANCETNHMASIPAMELYDAYKKWCHERNYRPLGERVFGKEVFRVFPVTRKARVRNAAQRFWSYDGIISKETF